jgi:Domain of unknown function (DUF6471)
MSVKPPSDRVRQRKKLEWSRRWTSFIDKELRQRGITYGELARRLTLMGISETEASIARQINEGAMPTWLFFAAMESINVVLGVCPRVK